MINFRSKRFCRGTFRFGGGVTLRSSSSSTVKASDQKSSCGGNKFYGSSEIKWELRPGGMVVQRREDSDTMETITLKISTVSQLHHISIQATSTFGELKMLLSMVTGLEPREQRLLFKGKEREDDEYLHMVGVKDNDKVLLLEDPAAKESKLHISANRRTISV